LKQGAPASSPVMLATKNQIPTKLNSLKTMKFEPK